MSLEQCSVDLSPLPGGLGEREEGRNGGGKERERQRVWLDLWARKSLFQLELKNQAPNDLVVTK